MSILKSFNKFIFQLSKTNPFKPLKGKSVVAGLTLVISPLVLKTNIASAFSNFDERSNETSHNIAQVQVENYSDITGQTIKESNSDGEFTKTFNNDGTYTIEYVSGNFVGDIETYNHDGKMIGGYHTYGEIGYNFDIFYNEDGTMTKKATSGKTMGDTWNYKDGMLIGGSDSGGKYVSRGLKDGSFVHKYKSGKLEGEIFYTNKNGVRGKPIIVTNTHDDL